VTRRNWISTAALGALPIIGYPTLFEPRWLELTSTRVKLAKWKGKESVRILHLADFHASLAVPHSLIDRAIEIGIQQQPDLACLTGDFITFTGGFNPKSYERSLAKLARVLPTYAVLGNHDGGKWAPARGGFADHKLVEKILECSGVKLMHNKSELRRFGNQDLVIAGVGDLWSEEIHAEAAFQDRDGKLPTILLSHNPDSKACLANFPWDLMLCGHTHGGQVIIPFEGPRYAPVQDKQFVAGLKSWRDRQIYITRGVGNLGSVRFRCRPEITVLEIV